MTPDILLAAAPCLLPIAVTLGYALTCAVWPFGKCRRCHGAGKLRAPLGRVYRICPRCHHTGLRPRIGVRLWNMARRVHRDGTQ